MIMKKPMLKLIPTLPPKFIYISAPPFISIMPQTNEILTWAAVVFATGFVGYFGKYLSKWIISLFGKKEKPASKTHPSAEALKAKYAYKLERQRLKALKKKRK
jgi:hypothetical protein